MLLILEIIDDENECLQLENLYNEYGKEMFHHAFEILNNEADAEDAIQIAFFRIWRNLGKLRKMDNVSIRWYLLCAARNSAIDIYRKRRVRSEKEEPIIKDIFVKEPIPDAETNDDIFKIVANFPPRERDSLILRYVYEMRYKEIARELGTTTEAVKKALQRGKNRLLHVCQEKGLYND